MRIQLAFVAALGISFLSSGCAPPDTSEQPTPPATRVSSPTPTLGPIAGTIDLENPAVLRGRVHFKGEVNRRTAIDMSMDRLCLLNSNAPSHQEDLIVDSNAGLRDVVVYIEGLDAHADAFPLPTHQPHLYQQGCTYKPHVIAARIGQPIRLINRDKTTHMYHFIGRKNDEINRTQAGVAEDILTFERAEIGAMIMCDVHPWMRARVHLFKHPCFAITEPNGSFELPAVPPGRYRLHFWHERCAQVSMDIALTANEQKSLSQIFLQER